MPEPIFTFEVSKPLDVSKIADAPKLLARLAKAMAAQNELTVAHIVEKYASFPSDQPPTMDGLRSISGRLRDSYRASAPVISGEAITSDFGSNVEYAGIQEFGGQTKAHDIVARNGKALAFSPGSGKFFTAGDFQAALKGARGSYRLLKTKLFVAENGIIFRKKVRHPGSDIPARQPVQRGIEDRLKDYSQAFGATIQQQLTS